MSILDSLRRLIDCRSRASRIQLQRIETSLCELHRKVEDLMADITLTKAALEALNTTTNTLAGVVTSVVVADQAEDDAFRAEIQALKDQIASGQAVTQADLDALTAGMGGTKATLEALATALEAIGASPTVPIPPIDIPPVDPNPPVPVDL